MTPHRLLNPKNNRFLRSRLDWARLLQVAVLGSLTFSAPLSAQTTGAAVGGFMPGGRELFAIDFAQEPLGEFPKTLRHLRGSMEVVAKDGKRMLRASDSAEFLITLPEALPEHFTLEFDVITRADYSNEELAFEGTPAFNRGPASANVLWYRSDVSILGGREADNTYLQMPADLVAEIAGQPAEIRVDFNGPNLTLYTNGRRLVSMPDVKFVRGRVLRVFLGGHDTGANAVHLSRLRIADPSTSAPAVAQQQSALTGGTTGATGTTAAMAITGITANVNSLGSAWVTWNPLPVPASYVVLRWKTDDPTCCNAMSPPGQPLTGNGWQDGILTVPGTYAYRVIATTATGVISGEVSFVYRGPGTAVTDAVASGTATTGSTGTTTTGSGTTSSNVATSAGTSGGTGTTGTATAVAPTGATVLSPGVPLLTSPTSMATAIPVAQSSTPPAPAPSSPPPPAPSAAPATGRFSVVLTGFLLTKESFDDPLERDGRRNEGYGAAAVVTWDRKLNQQRSVRFLWTREYGDVRDGMPFPGRIKAGSASPQGGIWGGDRVPEGYDPAGAVLPAATEGRFPLLIWEGVLTAGVESIAVIPSVWERDTDTQGFDKYRSEWSTRSAGSMMKSTTIVSQTSKPVLTWGVIPFDAGETLGEMVAEMLIWPLGPMNIVAGVLGLSSDRPFGITKETTGGWLYQERVVVITQEKLASLPIGGGVTIPIQYNDPPDQTLGGALTLYLRVERIQ